MDTRILRSGLVAFVVVGGMAAAASPALAQRRAAVRSAPRVVVAPSRPVYGGSFYRPYYTFRPRVSIGFGFYAGYPVAYPYSYAYGYGYPYYASPYAYAPYGYAPYAYSYSYYPYAPSQPQPYPPAYSAPAPDNSSLPYDPSASNSIQAAPGNGPLASSGGVSFNVTPSSAAVFVDDVYVGQVQDFTATRLPLTMASGKHRIELRAEGYESMRIQVDVVAAQVIPYEGALRPIR
jgi:hypothetical protein